METITIDGVDENAFRHDIEDMLRFDAVEDAIERLRELLAPYARPGGILPERFLTVTSDEVEITGWDRLASRLGSHDRPQFPISAIGVVLADARALGGPGPQGGRLAPFIKTYYFTDDAYPFTNAAREDLLDGYTREGFGWQADYQATDATLAIKGIDDLYGTVIELEDRLLDLANPPEEFLRAGTIGACFLAALIHQALRETIRRQGLPRPLCVLAACDGVYPFFDAPVAGWDDCLAAADRNAAPADVWPSEIDEAIGEASLLSLISRKGTKHMALELGEDDLREAARIAQDAGSERLVMTDDSALRGLFHGVPMADLVEAAEQFLDAEEALATHETPLAEPTPAPAPTPDTASTFTAGLDPRYSPQPQALSEPDLPPEPEPEPEPAPKPVGELAGYDPFAEARDAFRLAEEARAFPSGASLRNRFKEEPVQRESKLQVLVAAARARLRRGLRRGRITMARGFGSARERAAAAAEQIGAVAGRARAAMTLAPVRRAGARCRDGLAALLPRRRR